MHSKSVSLFPTVIAAFPPLSECRHFGEKHADAAGPLQAWYHEARKAEWANSVELKASYRTASIINAERVVFDIGGGKYRLVVRINYASKTVFIRFVGTHAKYGVALCITSGRLSKDSYFPAAGRWRIACLGLYF